MTVPSEEGRDLLKVTVYLLSLDAVDAQWLGTMLELLDPHEVERASRFRSPKQVREFVSAHALRRLALAAAVGGTASDWRFETDPLGRPTAIFPPAGLQAACSLSHTTGLVGVAVVAGPCGCAIGFDLLPQSYHIEVVALLER